MSLFIELQITCSININLHGLIGDRISLQPFFFSLHVGLHKQHKLFSFLLQVQLSLSRLAIFVVVLG